MRQVIGCSFLLLGALACVPVEKGFSSTPCAVGTTCVNVAGAYAETAQQSRATCGGDAGTRWEAFQDNVTVSQTDEDGGPGPSLQLTIQGAAQPLTGTLHTDLSATFDPVNYETMSLTSQGEVYLLGKFSQTDGGVTFSGTYYYEPGQSTEVTTPHANSCTLEGSTFWSPEEP